MNEDPNPTVHRTILRYQIDPEWAVEARIEELLAFCREARIEEVMLLIAAEELSTGHLTGDELERFIALGRRMREALAAEGRELSLNPWTTIYQIPRGRRRGAEHDFRPMVGETGLESPTSVCPLDKNWQQWVAGNFARMAREIAPTAIWLDDDFRLHNHGPELGWGGCFCEVHLRRISEKVGEAVGRERLLDSLLRPGKPHPWRAAWFELSRETLLEALAPIREAVAEANPEVRLALMSSMPDQHAAEGRDWEALREAFAGDGPLLLRPHMVPYTQAPALQTVPSVTRQTLACLEGPVEAYPELENSPRCGIYSKSGAHTALQMLEGVLFAGRGITLNHFDNMGNGTSLDPAFAGKLAAAKPQLDALAALDLGERRAVGAQVLFSPSIAAHLELPPLEGPRPKVSGEELSLRMQRNPSGGGGDFSGSMQSLVHNSLVWGQTLGILGVAHRFNARAEPEQGPVFVNGQTLRAFPNADIEGLLKGCLVLDARSVEILEERGFAEAIGVRGDSWHGLNDAIFSYEQIDENDPAVYGIAHPRLCAQRCADKVLRLVPEDRTEVLSRFHGPDHTPLWPTATLARTPQGGHAVTLSYPLDGGAQFFMAFFNRFRRIFFQQLLRRCAPAQALAFSTDGTRCYRQPTRQGELFAVLNVSADPLSETFLAHSPGETLSGPWRVLNAEGHWQSITPRADPDKGELRFAQPIPPLRGGFLLHGDPLTSESSSS